MDKIISNEACHTFVVMAYKESPYLEECITSLLEQTRKTNIIISTSTPNQHITDIANRNSLEVKVNPDNSGMVCNWNFALCQAPTKYVTLIHQDDIYLPGYAENIITGLSSREDSLIAFTDYEELIEGRTRRHAVHLLVKRLLLFPFYIKKSWRSKFIKKLVLYLGNPVCCPSVSFNRDNIKDFRFSDEFTVNPDWDAWLKIADRNGSFFYSAKCLMQHRLCPENETATGLQENRRQQEDAKIFLRLWPTLIAKILIVLYSLSYIKERHNT